MRKQVCMKRTLCMKSIVYCLIFTMLFLAVGCGKKEEKENDEKEFLVYYLNKKETKIEGTAYEPQGKTLEELINEMVAVLETSPKDVSLRAPLSGSMVLLDYYYDEEQKQVMMEFDEKYKKMLNTTEVLTRAAIVRTLCQIEGVDYVSFQIGKEPLADTYGVPIGMMTGDMFIDNAGSEINAYERTDLRLYYANENGTGLIECMENNVVFNTNTSMEKLIVEQLVKGPTAENEDLYPIMSPETKLISVIVTDGVCYVSFDENFLTQTYNVSAETTIYAIVNSLIELPNVNKVQISVNGNTNIQYREMIPLSGVFERNLDIVGGSNP